MNIEELPTQLQYLFTSSQRPSIFSSGTPALLSSSHTKSTVHGKTAPTALSNHRSYAYVSDLLNRAKIVFERYLCELTWHEHTKHVYGEQKTSYIHKIRIPHTKNHACSLHCGDIHGDIESINALIENFEITPDMLLLFHGDYIDRGAHSLEVMCTLLELKLAHFDQVILLRGNHEQGYLFEPLSEHPKLNSLARELYHLFPHQAEDLLRGFIDVFSTFPLACIGEFEDEQHTVACREFWCHGCADLNLDLRTFTQDTTAHAYCCTMIPQRTPSDEIVYIHPICWNDVDTEGTTAPINRSQRFGSLLHRQELVPYLFEQGFICVVHGHQHDPGMMLYLKVHNFIARHCAKTTFSALEEENNTIIPGTVFTLAPAPLSNGYGDAFGYSHLTLLHLNSLLQEVVTLPVFALDKSG
ncbi:MAG: hypothetical protein UU47_C0004G0015 [candidate division TM6 bacterium GW2011_GWE2_41_16]|nr:MAG: hypothetical protein UU47_C0004G0015 [candidate division TM6 bacterium GW2011_GWE2_41_16]